MSLTSSPQQCCGIAIKREKKIVLFFFDKTTHVKENPLCFGKVEKVLPSISDDGTQYW